MDVGIFCPDLALSYIVSVRTRLKKQVDSGTVCIHFLWVHVLVEYNHKTKKPIPHSHTSLIIKALKVLKDGADVCKKLTQRIE